MAGFSVGEWVLLTSQKGKKWLVKIEDAPYSCHLGTIHMTDVVGREEGDIIETNTGAKLFLFRVSLEDYILNMKRQTQIIYPKDLAAMVFHADLHPGQTVLESGVGSGALTLCLLRAIGDGGRLISVEKRPEFAAQAMENVSRYFGAKHPAFHLVIGDIQDFSLRGPVDRVFLDLPEPWHAVAPVSRVIREGGLLLSLSPNVGQVQWMWRELKARGFANVSTFELLKRDWKIDELRARPFDRMVAHTGFIMVARKVRRNRPDVPPLQSSSA
ncbi:MAG: tRNA (adenine-N1)-methyltransferase [Syntrophobacteraceae bacterium]|jgi:tRNA (adenine57-N1/adenine58-N1)-methyltransferase|nr:tRNA (adenine-N1)-methyltransferase [Syntrophobacteraceae bacterium]MCU0589366.1 tRNA (adenine-N1)-methyltransferase [Syntrophobacteraceae bacterium]